MLAKEYLSQINDITALLIRYSLSISQNFPSLNNYNGVLYTSIENTNMSIAQKNISFKEIYDVIDRECNYNIKMIDGGIIQLNYLFDLQNDIVLKHRLAYFPSPYLDTYQNNQDLYEMDELYADIIKRNILPVPLRFDYDPSVNEGKNPEEYESIHPHSHLTLGQYENCRISVSNFISPKIFFEFLLKSFYGNFYYKNIFRKEKIFNEHKIIEKCVSKYETQSLHMSIDF